MSQEQATIVDVEANGVGTLVVVSPDDTATEGEQAVPPPEIGFTVTSATVLDTGVSYVVRVQMTNQGLPATHVVPVAVTLAVDAGNTTAVSGTNYVLSTTGGTILPGDTDIEFVVALVDSTDPSVVLTLTLTAAEQTAQQGFAVQDLTVTEPTFTLTINDDPGTGDITLDFSRGDVAVTALDFRAQTLQVVASTAAPAGGITVDLAVPAAQQTEFAARVQAPTQVVIPQGSTRVDVNVQGLPNSGFTSSAPTVPDAFVLSMTTSTSGVVVGTTEPTLRVDVSDYPQGTRRLSWQTLTSETQEGGQQLQLLVTHQSAFLAALRAEFSVQVGGTASSTTDYTLAPAPNDTVTIEGQATTATYTLTPLVDTTIEDEEQAEITLVPAAPDYAGGQVTLIEGPATHVTTILADDVPTGFSVQFDRPGYTYTSATYTDSYEVAVTLSEATSVPVNVEIEWVHPRFDIALAGALPTLITVPAGQVREAVTVTPLTGGANVGGTNGESRYLRGTITNVSAGTVGVADAFVVTVVGDVDDGVPTPPPQNFQVGPRIYADRLEWLGVTYTPPSGGNWGDNGEQPFDQSALVQEVYTRWKARQQGPVQLGDEGVQVVFELMEDAPGLVLRIGSTYDADGNVVKPGMEWYEGTVAQPVRDLFFVSFQTGANRPELRALEINAREESMPYFDNVQCKRLTFTTPTGTAPTEDDNAVRATDAVRVRPQDHGALWLDQCAYRDYEKSATESTAGAASAQRAAHIVLELRCMPSITGDTDSTNVGRAGTFMRWTNHSVGQFIMSDVALTDRVLRALDWNPDTYSVGQSVMSCGLAAIVDVLQSGGFSVIGQTTAKFDVTGGLYGHLNVLGVQTSSAFSQHGFRINSTDSRAQRGYQTGFTQQGAWYRTQLVKFGPSTSNALTVTMYAASGRSAFSVSGVENLDIDAYDAPQSVGGTTSALVWNFNGSMLFNGGEPFQENAAWGWSGERLLQVAPVRVMNRQGGVDIVGNGSLLTYAGVADSTTKYTHSFINAIGTQSSKNFVAFTINSYDGTDF